MDELLHHQISIAELVIAFIFAVVCAPIAHPVWGMISRGWNKIIDLIAGTSQKWRMRRVVKFRKQVESLTYFSENPQSFLTFAMRELANLVVNSAFIIACFQFVFFSDTESNFSRFFEAEKIQLAPIFHSDTLNALYSVTSYYTPASGYLFDWVIMILIMLSLRAIHLSYENINRFSAPKPYIQDLEKRIKKLTRDRSSEA